MTTIMQQAVRDVRPKGFDIPPALTWPPSFPSPLSANLSSTGLAQSQDVRRPMDLPTVAPALFRIPRRGSQRVLPRNVPAGQGASSEPPSSRFEIVPLFRPLSGQSCSQKLRRAPVWMGCQAFLVARRRVGRPTGGSTDPRQSGRLTKSRHARCIWAFQKEKKARDFGG